jgi:hypothetical protein
MSSNVVSSIDNNKPSEITHDVQEVRFAAVVGDITRGPKIDMKDIKRTAKRPRKDELAVPSDGSIRSDTMRALKDPSSHVFATVRPEKP